MDMTGERRIAAPRQKVWEALNTPDILKAAIPGCDKLEMEGTDSLKASVAVKIGPISARFNGKVQLLDLDPPNAYRIEGEGQGGVAGFAKGGAVVRLVDDGAGTLLTYDVKAQVGGKIAQLGARLIDATAKQMADAFFNNFSAAVALPPVEAAAGDAADRPAAVPAKVAAAPGISLFDLIPAEIGGQPIVVWIGVALFAPILLLLLSAYL
jgi:carbon monoxide dehydrogenase subunit G